MAVKLLQLCLCILTLIQLTSSQPTGDDLQPWDDGNSCEHIDQVLNQLVTAVSQLQTANSRLQRDVTELKATVRPVRSMFSTFVRFNVTVCPN